MKHARKRLPLASVAIGPLGGIILLSRPQARERRVLQVNQACGGGIRVIKKKIGGV